MRLLCLAFLLATFVHPLWAARSLAQAAESPPGGPYEQAISESLAAHEAGDFARAQRSMEQAHALVPSARTLRGLGIIAHSSGDYVSAVQRLEAALAERTRPLDASLRASVERLLEDSRAHVGRYVLSVEPQDADLTVDGAPATRDGACNVLLSRGQHELLLRAPGRLDERRTITTRGGELQTLHAHLAAPEPGPPAATPSPALALQRAEPQGPDLRPRRASLALLAGGSALLVSSLSVYLVARERGSSLSCAFASGCSAEEKHALERAEHVTELKRASAVLGVLGAVGLVSALVVWRRSAARPSSPALALGPREARVMFRY